MAFWRILATVVALVSGTLAGAQVPAGPAPRLVVSASEPSTPARSHPLTKQDVDAWLDGYMPYALTTHDIPGAVVVIVKDGQVLTARGFGFADVAKRLPVDPARTLFRPGSVSKLFTWTAVMQLAERHRIDLDADVNRYLDFHIPDRDGKPITLRQIMTHTAGFEDRAKGVVFYDARYLDSLGDYLRNHMPARIFPPGTTPAYSNYATALAGYIVQRVSGQSFDDYVEAHVLAPLGMRDATFRQPLPAGMRAAMAIGYAHPGTAAKFEIVGPAPAGSLSATGLDMGRFMIATLQGGEIDGQRILSPATMLTMLDSPLDRVDRTSLLPPLNRMELGFFQINLNGHRAVGHLGDTNAFHTALDLLPQHNIGIYISVNGAGKEGAGGQLRLTMPDDFARRYLPAPALARPGVMPEVARVHAVMMAGMWEASRRVQTSFLTSVYALGQIKIETRPDGALIVPALLAANGRPREWVEIAPFAWQDRNGQERLAAKVVDGRIVRWSFDLAAPWEVFDRVPAARSRAWIVPAVSASLAVLLVTFLFWPAAWFARRRYGASIALAGPSLIAYRATRIIAGLAVAVMAGWALLVASLVPALPDDPDAYDTALSILQPATAIILAGAVAIAAWNLWLTWTDGRRWPRKLWSVLVFVSASMLLYVAVQFELTAMTVNY